MRSWAPGNPSSTFRTLWQGPTSLASQRSSINFEWRHAATSITQNGEKQKVGLLAALKLTQAKWQASKRRHMAIKQTWISELSQVLGSHPWSSLWVCCMGFDKGVRCAYAVASNQQFTITWCSPSHSGQPRLTLSAHLMLAPLAIPVLHPCHQWIEDIPLAIKVFCSLHPKTSQPTTCRSPTPLWPMSKTWNTIAPHSLHLMQTTMTMTNNHDHNWWQQPMTTDDWLTTTDNDQQQLTITDDDQWQLTMTDDDQQWPTTDWWLTDEGWQQLYWLTTDWWRTTTDQRWMITNWWWTTKDKRQQLTNNRWWQN